MIFQNVLGVNITLHRMNTAQEIVDITRTRLVQMNLENPDSDIWNEDKEGVDWLDNNLQPFDDAWGMLVSQYDEFIGYEAMCYTDHANVASATLALSQQHPKYLTLLKQLVEEKQVDLSYGLNQLLENHPYDGTLGTAIANFFGINDIETYLGVEDGPMED